MSKYEPCVKIRFENKENGISIDLDEAFIRKELIEIVKNFFLALCSDKNTEFILIRQAVVDKLVQDFSLLDITKEQIIDLSAEKLCRRLENKKLVQEKIIKILEEKENK